MDLLDKIDLYTFDGEYVTEDKAEYDAFVKKKLGNRNLGDMNDEETKEFFAMIDKEWKGEDEKANEEYKEEDDESKEHEDSESKEEEEEEHKKGAKKDKADK